MGPSHDPDAEFSGNSHERGVFPYAPVPRRRGSHRMTISLQAAAVVLDVISVWVAFWLAYEMRYRMSLPGLQSPTFDLPFSQFTSHAAATAAFLLVIFPTQGVYQTRHRLSVMEYVPRVVGGYTLALAAVILVAYFIQFSPSRAVYIFALVLGLIFMIGHRGLGNIVRRQLLARGIGVDRAIVVGSGDNARRLMQSMLGQSHWGYDLVGFLSDDHDQDIVNVATESGVRSSPYLGRQDDLERIIRTHQIDEVFVVNTRDQQTRLEELVDRFRSSSVQFRLVPDLLQISLDQVDITEINGVPVIGVREASIRGWNAVLKRTADIVVSALILVVLAVPLSFVALMVRRDSDGPVLYRQERIGQYGQAFTMYKFRGMFNHADQQWADMIRIVAGADGRLFKDPDDPRITRFGHFLRSTSIDEFPQLWNVLRGDMSLIGPRPPLPGEVGHYEHWHMQRLLVRPGMTGLWQVNGRSNLTFDQMVRLDLYYAENWSLWMDIRILLRTIPAVFSRRGAY